ncbi:MAG: hypothetical protein IKD90_06470 [Clostridiales bacterium]|nr:hypothetical protein [Clostridiales bacterium]
MKQSPIKNNVNPGYPTLEQVKHFSKVSAVTKIAAVTALAATMSLATGCGDKTSEGNGRTKGFLGGMANGLDFGGFETTEMVIDGDVVQITTEPTDETEVLMGEETIETEPSDDCMIEGEIPCETCESDDTTDS